MNSRPCEHCIGLMKEVGIKRVLYSDDNNNIVKESTSKMDQNKHTSFGYKYMISHIFPNKYPDMTRRHSPSPQPILQDE